MFSLLINVPAHFGVGRNLSKVTQVAGTTQDCTPPQSLPATSPTQAEEIQRVGKSIAISRQSRSGGQGRMWNGSPAQGVFQGRGREVWNGRWNGPSSLTPGLRVANHCPLPKVMLQAPPRHSNRRLWCLLNILN